MLLLRTLIPESDIEYNACEEYLINATNYETYMAAVYCVRQALGATRMWPGKVRIFRRFEAFARDAWVTRSRWSEEDFMIHGWKAAHLNATTFEDNLDLSLCDHGLQAWEAAWRKDLKVEVHEIRYES
ncbi:unnamed protein product [Strongylus vulgaris]|uniref:Uncharacterized protein n=1 Tax=Strongylus vulgaris TaxID=40348 RepID=A0A3P7LUB5_STRVU|nr:unnamed protein product [Strongylus vulgaris]